MAIPLTPELQAIATAQDQANAQQAPAPVIPAAVPAAPVTTPVSPIQPEDSALPQTLTPPQNAPGTFNKSFSANLDTMAVAPNQPGSFARSLVSSAINALGGITAGLADGNVGQVKNGGGWIEGVTEALQNRENRLRQQKLDSANQAQRDAENKRADTALDLDKQRTAATLAQATINGLHTALIMRNEDEEHQSKLLESAQTASKPFKEMGSTELGHGLTGDQIKQMLADKKLNPAATLHFQDGNTPVLDREGNQVIKDGLPQTQPTFELLTNVPRVTLQADQVADLNKYGDAGQKFQAGQPMDGVQYFLLHTRAQNNKAVALNVEKLQDEINASQSANERDKAQTRVENLTIDEKLQNKKAAAAFAPYLAANDGDPITAMQQLSRDPKGKAWIGPVEAMYGPGNIARARRDELVELQKTLDGNAKILAEHNPKLGGSELPQEEIDDMAVETKTARARQKALLGLHPSDPDLHSDILADLTAKGVPVSEWAARISRLPIPDADKAYMIQRIPTNVPKAVTK